jgi:hypothetical protein
MSYGDDGERYVPNGRPLTPYEREVLENLQEEAAEVIVAASKVLRFGLDNRPEDGIPNTEHLGIEVGNLNYMIIEAIRADIVTPADVSEGCVLKEIRFRKFLQNPPEAT